MEDTDWRPSPCPGCDVMREARRYPVCENTFCNYFGLTGDVAEKLIERTMKTEQKQKYVWRNSIGELLIIDDLSLLFKLVDFDAENDQVFELGREVKLKMQIVATPVHPVTSKPARYESYDWGNKE